MENSSKRQQLNDKGRIRFHAREQTLRDFNGVFSLPNLNRNVSEAKHFVDSIVKDIGAKEGVEHQILIASWSKIAGEFVAKHTEPYSLFRGVLVLKVVQPAMRFHLEEAKGKLLKNLQDELGKTTVKQIRFQIS
jgi:hypothetical protein